MDPAPIGELVLTEIVVDPADPLGTFAVIDGTACRPGDLIRGWSVYAVDPGRVRLGKTGDVTLALTPAAAEPKKE